jgi:thiamine pyrophosphate-dependent acetolactate synthase large subunit-like protein
MLTTTQESLPITIVVYNNGKLVYVDTGVYDNDLAKPQVRP